MKTVFIAHRLKGDFEENMKSALRWARWAALAKGVAPIVPYAYLCLILNDNDEDDRFEGTNISMEIMKRCDEIWVCGPMPGEDSLVWRELEEAERLHMKISNFIGLDLPKVFADFEPHLYYQIKLQPLSIGKSIEAVEGPRDPIKHDDGY